MFEGIHFLDFRDSWLSERSIARVVSEKSEETLGQKEQLRSATREQERYQFTIDGRVRLLLPYPTTPEDQERYYYPQVFALCQCGPSYYTRRSDFNSYEILYTYEGHGKLEYEGKTYELGPGDGFFIDCSRPHHYFTAGDNWTHSDLHFLGPQAECHFAEFFKRGDPTFHDPLNGQYQTLLEMILRIWDNFLSYKHLQVSNYISDAIASLLVKKHVSDAGSTTPETIAKLVKYIESNFAAKLTLDTLAEQASLSKDHLSREFQRYTGMSPVNYVIFTRIENAKIMLAHTNLPIRVVAAEVGFSDLNNFTNQFRKLTGMTPREFRKT